MTTVEQADSQTFEAVVLLYLASSRLPDGDLDETEAKRVVELTRAHTEGLAPGYGEQAVRDVAADLATATDVDAQLAKVVAAAELVAKNLSEPTKRKIVDELISITDADGSRTLQEREFVAAVAKTFGL